MEKYKNLMDLQYLLLQKTATVASMGASQADASPTPVLLAVSEGIYVMVLPAFFYSFQNYRSN